MDRWSSPSAAKSDGTASDGLDWAIQHVDDFAADTFVWDADGIGLGLAREVERQLGPRNVGIVAVPWRRASREPRRHVRPPQNE